MKFEKYTVSEDETITIPRPESYADCLTLVASDVTRTGRNCSTRSRAALYALTHPFNFLVSLRMCSHKGLLFPIWRMFYKMNAARCCIDISYNTKIGYGLNLGHKMCMVVNGLTVIGNNVNLS